MTFVTTFERSHAPNTATNKDDKAIHGLLLEWGTLGGVDGFRQRVVEYIATARKEARTAAFKDARRIAHRRIGLMTNGNESWLTAERVEELCDEINEHFEAAANSEEGAGNG